LIAAIAGMLIKSRWSLMKEKMNGRESTMKLEKLDTFGMGCLATNIIWTIMYFVCK
jgi:hypothetical protein